MNKYIVILTSITLLLTGCAVNQNVAGNSANKVTAAPTEVPQKELTDDPASTPKEAETSGKENWVSIEKDSVIDPFDDFIRKVSGVWGKDGGYFQQFDGTTIKRGWFESDMLPDAHITEVTKLSDNKYEVSVEDRGVIDDPEAGFEYHGSDYTAVFDGSYDGFKSVFVLSSDDKDTLFVKMGDTMEEANVYSWEGFSDDYRGLNEELMGIPDPDASASGIWYTEGYDEYNDWASSYFIDLSPDGSALCLGYRNKDTGTYEMINKNTALITFDHCEIDSPGEGWVPVEGFVYTIEMTIDGNDATIKIDAPDVITNLTDGVLHRKG